jgi:hypothetical protein
MFVRSLESRTPIPGLPKEAEMGEVAIATLRLAFTDHLTLHSYLC